MAGPIIRMPAVAGQFYPATISALERCIKGLTDVKGKKQNIIGAVSPHAGYVYSGSVAGAVFSRLDIKETNIVLGPNHTGSGQTFSIMGTGVWRMPFGDVQIDEKLAQDLCRGCGLLKEDMAAQAYEHSIEVQLPFMQYFKKDFKFVPIVISYSELKLYKQLGIDMANVIKQQKKEILIIASTDMTHYEPHEIAKSKDQKAIEAILALDEDLLFKRIHDLDISMCGYAPTIVMLAAAKVLGAKKAELIKYQTSGDTSGDYKSVVGYAGIIII